MVFDPGAGVAAAGEAMGKVAGLATLEQQKSGLETEKLKLANDLAMTRESKGRQETAALQSTENQRHEGFLTSEGKLNRESSERTAGMTAGTHLQGIKLQIEAAEKQGEIKIGEDGTGLLINRKTGKTTPLLDDSDMPLKFANPEKAKAQAELITTTRDQLTSTVRLYETDLKQAQAELTAALKSPNAMIDPQKDPGVIEARKAIDAVRQRYEPKLQMMTGRMNQLYTALGVKADLPNQAPAGKSISDFDRTPAPAAPAPRGLLDQQ